MQFKAGDKVRLKKKYSFYGWVFDMDGMENKVLTVWSTGSYGAELGTLFIKNGEEGMVFSFSPDDVVLSSSELDIFIDRNNRRCKMDKMHPKQLQAAIEQLEANPEDWQAPKIISLKRLLKEKTHG